MKQLESHPMFNPAIKVVDAPQKEKKTLPVSDDKEDLSFNLFEQAEKEAPAEKGTQKKQNPKGHCNITGSTGQYVVLDHWNRCCNGERFADVVPGKNILN